MTTLKDMALQYAEDGLFVFPLKAGTKTPAVTGYRALKWGAAEIERWWSKHPDDNIGISLDLNGLVCVDADIYKPDCEWDRGEDIATAMVRTARGGLHFYFSAPSDHDFRGTYGKSVDIKHKGFSALPPSRFDGGTYEWDNEMPFEDAPEWLLAMTKASKATSGGGDLMSMLEAMDVEAAMVSGRDDEAYRYIDIIDSATNPAGLDREGYWAVVSGMADHYKGTSLEQEAYDATAAWAESWEGGKDVAKLRSDFDRDWNSVRKGGGIKIASTMHILKKAGAITKAEVAAIEAEHTPRSGRLLTPMSDIDDPIMPWLVEGLIRVRGSASFTGISGVGKTTVTAAWVAAMLAGKTEVVGLHPIDRPLKIAWLNAEEDRGDMKLAIEAAVQEYGLTIPDDAVIIMAGEEALMDQRAGLSLVVKVGTETVENAALVKQLTEELVEAGVDLLIADPITEFNDGNENDRGDTKMLNRAFRKIAQGCGAAVLYWAHTGKVPEGKRPDHYKDDIMAQRGSSASAASMKTAGTAWHIIPADLKVEDAHAWVRRMKDREIPNMMAVTAVKTKKYGGETLKAAYELRPSMMDRDTAVAIYVTYKLAMGQTENQRSMEVDQGVAKEYRILVKALGVGTHNRNDISRVMEKHGWPKDIRGNRPESIKKLEPMLGQGYTVEVDGVLHSIIAETEGAAVTLEIRVK